MTAVGKIDGFLQNRFGVKADFLKTVNRKDSAESVLAAAPELATLNFAEYFMKNQSKKRLVGVFKKVTIATKIFGSPSKPTSQPTSQPPSMTTIDEEKNPKENAPKFGMLDVSAQGQAKTDNKPGDWIEAILSKANFDILHVVNVAEIYDMVWRMFKYGQKEVSLDAEVYDQFIREVQALYNHR